MTAESVRRVALWVLSTAVLLGVVFTAQYHRVSREPDLTELGYFALEEPGPRGTGPLSMEGSWTVVFFGFTSCPDVCPTTLSVLNLALGDLENPPTVLMVSVDPKRDVPELVEGYVSAFNPSFRGISVTEEETRSLANRYGIAYEKVFDETGDNYLIEHSGVLVVLDPAGLHTGYIRPPLHPEQIRDLAILLMGAS